MFTVIIFKRPYLAPTCAPKNVGVKGFDLFFNKNSSCEAPCIHTFYFKNHTKSDAETLQTY